MTELTTPVFATILRAGELPLVVALAADLGRHHPGTQLHALALDGSPEAPIPSNVTLVTPREIGISETRSVVLRLMADPADARMATAPTLLIHLLATSGGTQVIYLTPDTVVMAPLPTMPSPGVTLIPRAAHAPIDDGLTPEAHDLLGMTMFDDGFLVVGPDAGATLTAVADGIDDLALATEGVAGRVWDLMVTRPSVTVADDPALGVAYWNAVGRDGPIITLRLPGFDPGAPYLLSHQQGLRPRVLLSERPDLRAVVAHRLEGMAEAGMIQPTTEPRIGSLVIDDAVRSACRQAVHADPAFVAELLELAGDSTGESLMAWLAETAPGSRESRITRYLLGIWRSDPYTAAAFPNPTDDHSEHLIRWVRASSEVLRVPARFLPRPTSASPIAAAAAPSAATELLPGVNLIGFLRAGFGIGEATRLLHEALIAGEVPHSAISVSHADLEDKVESTAGDDGLRYDVNLVCVNVDWLDMLSRRLGSELFAERYFIGTWWWESNVLPPELVAEIDYFDELWAGSTYVAEALSAYTDRPIRVFPLPIRIPPDGPLPDRASMGLPEGYLFMFSFDFNSTVERKNPEAVFEAFIRAFPEPAGTQLVLKTINGHRHVDDLERLRALIAHRDDITIFDGFLSTEDRDAWASTTDCYVSLHRCEGFGLTMAEAMALGKPVIATNYSANLDFMDATTAYLVPADEWRLEAQAGPYPAGTVWADPDVDAAAAFMRQVAHDPGAARELGARAREHIQATRTPDRLAQFVSRRLEEIRMEERQLRPRPNIRLTAKLNDALSYDRQRQGMRQGLLGRIMNRLIRPYSATADELDRRMLAAMVELGERLDDLDRGLDSTEQTVEALAAEQREGQRTATDS